MQQEIRQIAQETMLGDLMHIVLDCAKALPKPWSQLGEHEQDDWLSSIEKQCTAATEKVVSIIASSNHVSVRATLASVTFKDGVKAALTVDKHSQHRIDLADAAGKTVELVILEEGEFTGSDSKPKADANQAALDLDDTKEAERTSENDPHLQLAADFVRTSRKCTISAIQRHLAIGYNRAARLLEQLEIDGVVSPMNAEGKRVVLAEKPAEAKADETS